MPASLYSEKCGYQFLADSKLNNVNKIIGHGNYLRLAADRSFGNLYDPCLVSDHAYRIDLKIDDGNPLKGMVFADNFYQKEVNDASDFCVCYEGATLNYCNFNGKFLCIFQLKIS